MMRLQASVLRQWYHQPTWLWLLLPLTGLFILLSAIRKPLKQRRAVKPAVPVLVVGNITVGGTGKTPLLIALVQHLQSQGLRPGVISRGFGGTGSEKSAELVTPESDPVLVGDEPVMIAQTTGCPVAVSLDRVAAAEAIMAGSVDVILSDDGLQHYRLARDLELVVVDGKRGLGNGWRLPVGPLREPLSRLKSVDWVVANGELAPDLARKITVLNASAEQDKFLATMVLAPSRWRNVRTGEVCPLAELNLADASAIAGIGHPQRFFDTLHALGFAGDQKAFPDHYCYGPDDFRHLVHRRLLMTTKDAVKCAPWAGADWWALEVQPQLPDAFLQSVVGALQTRVAEHQQAQAAG